MARLSSEDLAAVQVTEDDRAEVAVGATPPPPRRGGGPAPSRWLTIIKIADDLAASEGTEPEEIEGVTVQVGPSVQYPKTNQPTVWSQNIVPVRKAFGPESPYADEHDGDYFEITLRDTVKAQSASGGSENTRGVLWVRKVIVPKGEEQ